VCYSVADIVNDSRGGGGYSPPTKGDEMREPFVLVATPNYTNTMSSEAHVSHIEAMCHWTKIGLKFSANLVGRTFVHFARTQFCQLALDGGFTHIFWLDDDAAIEPDLLPKLLAHDKDLIMTPYPMRKPPHEIGILSSETGDFKDHSSYRNMTTKDLNQGIVQVDGGGTHAMLMKTEVLEKSGLADVSLDIDGFYSLKEENEMGAPYVMMPKSGTEDMYLCYRLKLKNVEIWCDTDLFANHIGFAPIITLAHTETMENLALQSAETRNNIPVLQVRNNSDDVLSRPGQVSALRGPSVDTERKASLA